MAIAIPVTPQAVLRCAVPTTVVPGLVLFSVVSPFICVDPYGPLRRDQHDLSWCPTARRSAVVAGLNASVRFVEHALTATAFVDMQPMSTAKAEDIKFKFVHVFGSILSLLQSSTERALEQCTREYVAKIEEELLRTVWAEEEMQRSRFESRCRAIMDIPLLTPPAVPSLKRPRRASPGSDEPKQRLTFEVLCVVQEAYRSETVTFSLRSPSLPPVSVTLDEDDLEVLGDDDEAEFAEHFRGTRFEQLLSPPGVVALCLAIGKVISQPTGCSRLFDRAVDMVGR